MDAFKLHELLHSQPSFGSDINSSVNQHINIPVQGNNQSVISDEPIQVGSSRNPFPWKVVGIIIAIPVGLWIYDQIRENIGYKSKFRRRLSGERSS